MYRSVPVRPRHLAFAVAALALGLVPALACVDGIAAGRRFSIAVKSDRTLVAWGANASGQLGIGSTADSLIPTDVLGIDSVATVSAGSAHVLAVRNDGSVWAWGSNSNGQLGNGTTIDGKLPQQVPGLSNVVEVAAGGRHSLALKSDGTVWAWGFNGSGQLGINSKVDSWTPLMTGLGGVRGIAAGADHSLAMLGDATMWAWGSNAAGQLGDGSGLDSGVPLLITALSGITLIGAGADFSFAFQSAPNTLWAWGNDSKGQFGNGNNLSRSTPISLGKPLNVPVAGGAHTLWNNTSTATLLAAGANASGQLGDSNNNDSNLRVPVTISNRVYSLAAGEDHSIAEGGYVWTWGDNSSGELGDGTRNGSNVPVMVGFDVVPIAALKPLPDVCIGGPLVLDATPTAPNGCPVRMQYRFRDGTAILQGWGFSATFGPVTAGVPTTYSVDVRCTALDCQSSASVSVAPVNPPLPVLSAPAQVCDGQAVTLDATGSSVPGCSGAAEYQFRAGASVLQAWGPAPALGPFVPGGTTTYSVDVRCAATPGCTAAASRPVAVLPPPIAAAGPDVSVCKDHPLTLDGSGSSAASCPGGALYEWRSGVTVLRAASPIPTWAPPTGTLGAIAYALAVSCSGLPGCVGTDDVVVTVKDCTLAVRFASFEARRGAGAAAGAIAVKWTTALEQATLGFEVERSSEEAGPFELVSRPIDARGAWSSYRFEDVGVEPSSLPWYRVVELLDSGEGDRSPAFRTRAATAASRAGGRRRGPRLP